MLQTDAVPRIGRISTFVLNDAGMCSHRSAIGDGGAMCTTGHDGPVHARAGPLVPKAALERIASYVGVPAVAASLDAAEALLRERHSQFHPIVRRHCV